MAGCVVREGRIRMDGWILSSEGFATTGCGGGWIALHCTAYTVLRYIALRYRANDVLGTTQISAQDAGWCRIWSFLSDIAPNSPKRSALPRSCLPALCFIGPTAH